MNVVFADSYYFLAFLNERDGGHSRAIQFSTSYAGRMVTTEWVLTEVADAMSSPEQRPLFLELLFLLRSQPGLEILEASHELFERGLTLFEQRSDKAWSLTDCISFVVMQQRGIADALTADRHFIQAGYSALFAD
jgi:predicted nucleic acid-binding protein